MRFVERFRYKASKAKAVQARIKLLEKRDLVQLSETDNRHMNMRLKVAKQPGKVICTLKKASKSYPDIEILRQAEALIERGDKIALIGPNGKGKSTLLRILFGSEPFEGEREEGHQVSMAFYAQHQLEALQLNNTVLEEAQRLAFNRTEQELRNTLGAFLFSNEEVDKKVKVLSGGEKARVALAGIMLSEANFLLLDEPTNHLDMDAVDMLIESLQQYEGSFIAVSHDRYFLEEVANKLWYIQNGEIKVYPGSYQSFTERYGEQFFFQPDPALQAVAPAETKANTASGKVDYEKQKEQRKQYNKLQQQLEKIEKEMAALQLTKADLLVKIGSEEIFTDFEALQQCQTELHQVDHALEQCQQQWEAVFEAMAELE